MKRSQDTVAPSPQHKKPKVLDDATTADTDSGWTRVDRRKAKKVRKREAKHDVRTLVACPKKMTSRFIGVDTTVHVCEQRNHQEKRRHSYRCESLSLWGIIIIINLCQDVRDLVLHIIADAPPPNWVRIDVRLFPFPPSPNTTRPQNARSVQKVVTLLIPGILPDFIALPPPPTSATANPNIPIAIPLPKDSNTPLPFIASTFSHACPTRAPGDQTRMYSVLGAFFQGPVSGEEKKRRIEARIACTRLFTHPITPDTASSCSRTRIRQGPIAIFAFVATHDRKRLSYTILHGRRLREARRLGRDATTYLRVHLAPAIRATTLEGICHRLRNGAPRLHLSSTSST